MQTFLIREYPIQGPGLSENATIAVSVTQDKPTDPFYLNLVKFEPTLVHKQIHLCDDSTKLLERGHEIVSYLDEGLFYSIYMDFDSFCEENDCQRDDDRDVTSPLGLPN